MITSMNTAASRYTLLVKGHEPLLGRKPESAPTANPIANAAQRRRPAADRSRRPPRPRGR